MPFISEVAPIFIQRFYTGWITLRNQLATPIRVMGRRVIELYDALIAGNDWEVTPALSLKRRAGHTFYATVNSPALRMYSWKTNTQGTIPIVDTQTDLEYIQSGGTTGTTITSKSVTTQCGILGIGNYFYMGNTPTNLKWDGPNGTQGVTNWGITFASAQTSETAGSGTSLSSSNPAWTNPGNVSSSVAYATTTLTSGFGGSQMLEAYNFGFSATGLLSALSVTFNASSTGASQELYVYLMYNGNPVSGGVVHFVLLSGTVQPFTVIFNASLITVAQLNNSTSAGFGIGFQAHGIGTASVNDVVVSVSSGGVGVPTPTGSGSLAAVNGWTYVVAYGNSVSGEVSNASVPSQNTGPFATRSYVALTVAASSDPQVNQIRVYRTTDSGGGNQFFELPNSPFPNTSTTIEDTSPDTSLQVTSQAEINLGNTPPPANITNLEWFAGRTWGSVGNILYASTGAETISGSAPNSNWNPEFQWVIPGPIQRLVTGPNGMLVFTLDDCYIVRGTDITNFTVNLFVKDFGIRSFNCVDTDGTNLYVFTSDRQFICLTASGATDMGLAIGDQLLTVDPTQAYLAVNRYGLDSIVRLLDAANNLYYDYNLNQQCWNLPGLLQMTSCVSMGSIEVSPGVYRLLVNSNYYNAGVFTTASLAYRDITNFQDLGASYAPNAVFGSIQLSDPGTLSKFGARGGFLLELTTAGTVPTLSVLPNDIGCTLTNLPGGQITGAFVSMSTGAQKYGINWPPTLATKPVNYRSLGYYYSAAKGISALVRHIQFQLSAPSENLATELIGFGIFGDYSQEVETPGQIPQLQGR
jgi:hypothetical protein